MRTLLSLLTALFILAGIAPTLADKGGVPNENAVTNSNASDNAHGRNENANPRAAANEDPQPTKGADTISADEEEDLGSVAPVGQAAMTSVGTPSNVAAVDLEPDN
jgi:hypothetical protein